MPIAKLIRFRLWQMFAVVAVVAFGMWLVTQFGMETAEIEVLQFDTWPRNGAEETGSPVEVVYVKFKYVDPPELSNTSLILFFGEPAYVNVKNVEVGARIKFRYRARPMLWLKPNQPDPIAIRSLGLDPNDIEEIITDVNMSIDD